MISAIMDDLSAAVLDVRDMLCAQALALVAKAVDSLPQGGILDVIYNTEDVYHDLRVWTEERRCQLSEPNINTLRIKQG